MLRLPRMADRSKPGVEIACRSCTTSSEVPFWPKDDERVVGVVADVTAEEEIEEEEGQEERGTAGVAVSLSREGLR